MGKTTKIFKVFAIIATIAFSAWVIIRTVKEVQFNMNCSQYIERATNANTVETAKEELAKAISYAEENDLTKGIVSIFFHQPQNDVEYWYKNMTESYAELEKLPEDATSIEKTNVLMNLRETLTDQEGVSVTIPSGISIYPNNVAYFLWGLLSGIFGLVFWSKVVFTED